MNPSTMEKNISRVACLLDELNGMKYSRQHWEGYHPLVYGKPFDADTMVSRLCERLQSVDVTKYSLEMQIWWRDHQAADKKRVEREMQERKTADERETALSKLTPYERKLLGY